MERACFNKMYMINETGRDVRVSSVKGSIDKIIAFEYSLFYM
ncbi:hypothetical protein FHW89_002083 [Mucilaginibacter sp. SG564]|nr:hypothetical protein [Mucilaginibacter sp. SG564]